MRKDHVHLGTAASPEGAHRRPRTWPGSAGLPLRGRPGSGDAGQVASPRRAASQKHGASPLDIALDLRDEDALSTVRDALERRNVDLAFQPVVDGRDPSHLAFHEGLLRVIDDTGRVIPASEFIHICEGDEIGRMLDVAALDAGLQALAEEQRLRLAINMSARSIGYGPWTATLNRHLILDPTLGERLIIEITEHSAIQLPEIVSAFMRDLQGKGIAFALDDFGSGFTSFRYLRDFDFDILKIAGEFSKNLAGNPDNRMIYEAIVAIARNLDLLTVAEAVETEEDAALLIEIGVDCLQGYAFGGPRLRPHLDPADGSAGHAGGQGRAPGSAD